VHLFLVYSTKIGPGDSHTCVYHAHKMYTHCGHATTTLVEVSVGEGVPTWPHAADATRFRFALEMRADFVYDWNLWYQSSDQVIVALFIGHKKTMPSLATSVILLSMCGGVVLMVHLKKGTHRAGTATPLGSVFLGGGAGLS
jgi:hypothetical protein